VSDLEAILKQNAEMIALLAQLVKQTAQAPAGKAGHYPRQRPTGLERVTYVDQFGKQHEAYLERTYQARVQTEERDENGRFIGVTVTYSDLCVNTKLDGTEKWTTIPGVPNVDEPYLHPKNRYFITAAQVKGEAAKAKIVAEQKK
jgi:hypothetical protein